MDYNEYIKRMGIAGGTGYDCIKALINRHNYQTIAREHYQKYLQDNGVLTLSNVKNMFYAELASDDMSLEEYIREHYVPVYDAELNFIGYESK